MEALALLAQIDARERFDVFACASDDASADPRFRTSAMTSGKMLGVLLCQDGSVLRAFSGLLGGTAYCPGWSPPVCVPLESSPAYMERFRHIVEHVQAAAVSTDPQRSKHRRMHRELSLKLSAELEERVELRNARGDRARLLDVVGARRAKLPGGVGDCAAPKLLNEAYGRGLIPASLAEVWYEAPIRRGAHMADVGAQNAVATRRRRRPRREHGSLHPACAERCEPIMGFLLCGLEEHDVNDRRLG